MLYYFLGFLLIFLNYPILLASGGTLNVIPDFLGYAILMIAGLRAEYENARFRRLHFATLFALPLSAAKFVLDLLHLALPTAATLAIDVVMTVAALYVTYEFTEGAKAIEKRLYKKLDGDKLASAWFILGMASLLKYLAVFLPAVLLPCNLVYLLAIVWFESAVFQFGRKHAQARP